MKKIAVAALLALAASACASSDGYTASYSGNVTENYDCQTLAPPTFVLPNDQFTLDVDSAGNVALTIASCPGDTIFGVQSGNTVSIAQTATFTCQQADANGDTIQIVSIGGMLNFDSNGGLAVDLTEEANITNAGSGITDDTCTGVASGELF